MKQKYALIFVLLLLAGVLILNLHSASAVLLSDQGTDVKLLSNGTLLFLGNLTIEIYNSSAGGTAIFSQTFPGAIVNGSWNLMISPDLEYGKSYWKDYQIDGEDLDFDGDERLEFQSPLGMINNASLINFSLINSCPAGSAIKLIYENGSVECTQINSSINITVLNAGGLYLYNDSNAIYLNDTALNSTIDARTAYVNGTGIELSGKIFSLLTSCSDGQVLKWNSSSSIWYCSDLNAAVDLTNYALKNQSETFSGNITTTETGFFGFLGSLLTRVTKIFATDIDVSNDIVVGGNINTTGNVTAAYFIGDGSQLTGLASFSEQYNGTFNETEGVYVYNSSAFKVEFNETKLNSTIVSLASAYNESSLISGKLDITDQRYNETTYINTNFYNQTEIDNSLANKLNTTDQRYNETSLLNAVNSSENIKSLGFNLTSELNNLYYLATNPSGYITNTISTLTNFYNKTDSDARYLQSVSYQNSAAGWTNDSENTTTTLKAIAPNITVTDTAFIGDNTGHQYIQRDSDYWTKVGHHLTVPGSLNVGGGILNAAGTITNYGNFVQLSTGLIYWVNETFEAEQTNLYRSGTNTLRTNASFIVAENMTANNFFGNLNASYVQNAPWISNTNPVLNATSDIYIYQVNGNVTMNETKLNSTIVSLASAYNESSLISGKLDITDQRYNETSLLNAVNSSENIKSLGFNLTSELNNVYYLKTNPDGFINSTPYQDSAAGWTNDSTTTTTSLGVRITSSSGEPLKIDDSVAPYFSLYKSSVRSGWIGDGFGNGDMALVSDSGKVSISANGSNMATFQADGKTIIGKGGTSTTFDLEVLGDSGIRVQNSSGYVVDIKPNSISTNAPTLIVPNNLEISNPAGEGLKIDAGNYYALRIFQGAEDMGYIGRDGSGNLIINARGSASAGLRFSNENAGGMSFTAIQGDITLSPTTGNTLITAGNVIATNNVTANNFYGNLNASYIQNAPWLTSYSTPYQDSAAGWTNDTLNTNTSLNVNIQDGANLTVTGTANVTNLTIGGGNIYWNGTALVIQVT